MALQQPNNKIEQLTKEVEQINKNSFWDKKLLMKMQIIIIKLI